LVLAGASCVFGAKQAHAGGFELPDQGAQALGRGGAFVAKADDSTALYYNPAGLARQRGTKLQFSGNVQLHSFTFTRAGAYPDADDAEDTPWGQQSFPTMRNAGPPFLLPMVLGTTDFGYFDRLTLGFGVFGPSAIGNRTFQLGIQGAPAPSRYDAVQSKSSILYPSLGLGFRVTRWLDIGATGSVVLSNFDQTTVSWTWAKARAKTPSTTSAMRAANSWAAADLSPAPWASCCDQAPACRSARSSRCPRPFAPWAT
jgi:long-chain fatty acid transport protein